MARTVFISHAQADEAKAHVLRDVLEAYGIDVYLNHQQIDGVARSAYEQVREQIATRDYVLLLVSQHVLDSEPVNVEMTWARFDGKRIIPIMLQAMDADRDVYERYTQQFWFLTEVERVDFPVWRADTPQWFQSMRQLLFALDMEDLAREQFPSRTLVTLVEPPSLIDEHPVLRGFQRVKQIYVQRHITRGYSGSKVFVVKAVPQDSKAPPQTCFLKIHHSLGDTPLLRHNQAYEVFNRYMPELLDATDWDDESMQIALLYKVDGPVDRFEALDRLLRDRTATAARLIKAACEALYEWNTPIEVDKYHFMKPHELLAFAIGHSVDPSVRQRRLLHPDTSVFARLQRRFGLPYDTPAIRFEGDGFDRRAHWPNPLAYLWYPRLWREKQDELIGFLRGHVHGDMNVRNVLWSGDERQPLQVIDFDTYDPSNLLFIDFCQMELGILLELFNLDHASNRRELVYFSDYLARRITLEEMPDLGLRSVGANEILKPIRETISRFFTWDRELEASFWLARMAVGLEMARKTKVRPIDRVFALLFAADSLDTLLNFFRIEPASGGQPAVVSWERAGESVFAR